MIWLIYIYIYPLHGAAHIPRNHLVFVTVAFAVARAMMQVDQDQPDAAKPPQRPLLSSSSRHTCSVRPTPVQTILPTSATAVFYVGRDEIHGTAPFLDAFALEGTGDLCRLEVIRGRSTDRRDNRQTVRWSVCYALTSMLLAYQNGRRVNSKTVWKQAFRKPHLDCG